MLAAQPFEPFRIHLVTGTHFDVFDPLSVAPQTLTAVIVARDGTWAIFPYAAVALLESLMSDFPGQLAAHQAE